MVSWFRPIKLTNQAARSQPFQLNHLLVGSYAAMTTQRPAPINYKLQYFEEEFYNRATFS